MCRGRARDQEKNNPACLVGEWEWRDRIEILPTVRVLDRSVAVVVT